MDLTFLESAVHQAVESAVQSPYIDGSQAPVGKKPTLGLLKSGLLHSWGPLGLALLLCPNPVVTVLSWAHTLGTRCVDRHLPKEDVWEIQELQVLGWDAKST